jgi:hypothetical protein
MDRLGLSPWKWGPERATRIPDRRQSSRCVEIEDFAIPTGDNHSIAMTFWGHNTSLIPAYAPCMLREHNVVCNNKACYNAWYGTKGIPEAWMMRSIWSASQRSNIILLLCSIDNRSWDYKAAQPGCRPPYRKPATLYIANIRQQSVLLLRWLCVFGQILRQDDVNQIVQQGVWC